MTVKCVNTKVKKQIVAYYADSWTHDTLAEWYGVSRRTIARILQEAGVLKEHNPYTAEEKKILKTAQEFGFNSTQLRKVLAHEQSKKAPQQKARKSAGMNGNSRRQTA